MRKNRSNSVFLSRVDELLVLVPVEPNPQFAQEAWYGAVPCGWWVPTWVAWTSNGWRMPVIKRGNGHPSCIDDLRHQCPFRWLNDSQDWLKRLLNNGLKRICTVNNGTLDTSINLLSYRYPQVPLQLPECSQRYAGYAHDPWHSRGNGARNAWDAAGLENSIETIGNLMIHQWMEWWNGQMAEV